MVLFIVVKSCSISSRSHGGRPWDQGHGQWIFKYKLNNLPIDICTSEHNRHYAEIH